MKSGKPLSFWVASEVKNEVDNGWEDVLEWFELKTNKQYYRLRTDDSVVILIRDNIASIYIVNAEIE